MLPGATTEKDVLERFEGLVGHCFFCMVVLVLVCFFSGLSMLMESTLKSGEETGKPEKEAYLSGVCYIACTYIGSMHILF